MSQVEKLKIFFASPSDISTERRYLKKVIEELNRTVGKDKAVIFELTTSNNAFPGYGTDGQAILNEQFGRMHDYELFIGVMWNRIGTPTPRAASGTVEEFTRAVKSLVRRKRPDVWFYFRQSPTILKTHEELKQREEVLSFKAKFKRNGLFREYGKPADFQDLLREHLTLWLNERQKKKPKHQSVVTTKNTRKSAATKTQTTSASVTGKTNTSPQKKSYPRRKSTSRPGKIGHPGDWVMLDSFFFQTKLNQSSNTKSDQNILLKIFPKDRKEDVTLKALSSDEDFY